MNSYFSKRFHLAIPSVSSILLASIIAQPAALIAGCCGTGLNFSHSAYAKYIYNLQRSFPTIYRQFGGSRSSGTFPMTYSGATSNNSVQISRPGMRDEYRGFASILLGASLAISAALRLTPERHCCQCSARSGLIRCAHPCGAACRQSISAALRFPSSRPSPLLNLLSPTTPCTVVWLPCLDQSTFPELGSDLTSPVANGLVRAQR